MGSRTRRCWRQAVSSGWIRAIAAENKGSDLELVFAAIFWREDYDQGRKAVTHAYRSNTKKLERPAAYNEPGIDYTAQGPGMLTWWSHVLV